MNDSQPRETINDVHFVPHVDRGPHARLPVHAQRARMGAVRPRGDGGTRVLGGYAHVGAGLVGTYTDHRSRRLHCVNRHRRADPGHAIYLPPEPFVDSLSRFPLQPARRG